MNMPPHWRCLGRGPNANCRDERAIAGIEESDFRDGRTAAVFPEYCGLGNPMLLHASHFTHDSASRSGECIRGPKRREGFRSRELTDLLRWRF